MRIENEKLSIGITRKKKLSRILYAQDDDFGDRKWRLSAYRMLTPLFYTYQHIIQSHILINRKIIKHIFQ
jgi:hypothetical protein